MKRGIQRRSESTAKINHGENIISTNLSSMLYCSLLFLRFFLTIIPQTGLIHPDEFFQSTEIVAGDLLGIDCFRSWEFTCENPIRTVVLPFIIAGIPLGLLKLVDSLTTIVFNTSVINPFSVLVAPRLGMTLLSVTADIVLYKICLFQSPKGKPSESLLLYSSSVVSLVFLTRTLANSLECFLFYFLLYLVASSLNERRIGSNPGRRHKSKDAEAHLNRCSSFLVGVTLAAGVFNRPTFLAFAAVPILVWILKCQRQNQLKFFTKSMMGTATGILITLLIFVLCDSLYYGSLHLDDFTRSVYSINHLTITPLNFVQYNMNSTNLHQHGLHPRYVHLLVNVPLLFCWVGVFGVFYSVRVIVQQIRNMWLPLSLENLLAGSILVPLALLSLFPHQEPRFMIPLLVPLVAVAVIDTCRYKRALCIVWLSWNFVLILFYGFLHQGGIVPTMNYLYRLGSDDNNSVSSAVVFFHTYMPPRHLLLHGGGDENHSVSHTIHDLMGAHVNELENKLSELMKSTTWSRVITVMPTSLWNQIQPVLENKSFQFVNRFQLHLSMEDPPEIFNLFDQMGLDVYLLQIAVS